MELPALDNNFSLVTDRLDSLGVVGLAIHNVKWTLRRDQGGCTALDYHEIGRDGAVLSSAKSASLKPGAFICQCIASHHGRSITRGQLKVVNVGATRHGNTRTRPDLGSKT